MDYGIIGIDVDGQTVTARRTAKEALVAGHAFADRGFANVLIRDLNDPVHELPEFERLMRHTGRGNA